MQASALAALPEGFSSGPASQPAAKVASAESMPLPSQRSAANAAVAAAAKASGGEDEDSLFDWRRLLQNPTRQSPQPHAQQSVANPSPPGAAGPAIRIGAAKNSASSKTQGHVKSPAASGCEGLAAGPRDGTDALGRKVWDKAFYEAKAKDKDADLLDLLPKPRQKPQPPPLPPSGQRHQLKQRDFQIDLEREVGRTKVVTLQTPKMQQGGFWCDVCECLIKDSQAYLAHINGKNHNRLLGMSMRVERVSLAAVKAKLQEKRKQISGDDSALSLLEVSAAPAATSGAVQSGSRSVGGLEGEDGLDEFDRVKRRLAQLQQEEELKKKRRADKRKKAKRGQDTSQCKTEDACEKNAKDALPSVEADPEESAALAAMGLPTSFV